MGKVMKVFKTLINELFGTKREYKVEGLASLPVRFVIGGEINVTFGVVQCSCLFTR